LPTSFVVSKEVWDSIQKSTYQYDRVNTDGFEVTAKGDIVTITTTPKLLFENGIIAVEDISKKVFKLGGVLLAKEAISDIEIHQGDIADLAAEVKKLDILARTIKVRSDLSISCNHPEFNRITYEFLGWGQYEEAGTRVHKLVHPFNWRRDLALFERHNFTMPLTKEQKEKIEELEAKEGEMARKAYFFKSQNGYRVLIYELHSDIIKMLTNKCRFNYNKVVKGKMETIELVFVKAEMLSEIEKETGNEDIDRISQLVKTGYRSFTCYMFTLPSVKLTFRKNGIKFEGDDKLVAHFPKFSFKMPKPKLWDIQELAIQKWKENEYLGTVALPTGSGKTYIGAAAIQEIGLNRTVIVTPTVSLVFQWKRKLIELGVPEDKIGVYYGGEKELEGKEVVIITFQSGHRKISEEVDDLDTSQSLDEEESELVDKIVSLSETAALLVLDEGHHAPAPVFQRIMVGVKSPYRISLTATPYREDKNDVLAFMAMGDVIYTETYDVLAAKGYVAPIDEKRIMCQLDSAEEDVIALTAEMRVMRSEQYYSGSTAMTEKKQELASLSSSLKVNELAQELLGDYMTGQEEGSEEEGEKVKLPSPSVVMNFSAAKFDNLLDIVKAGGKTIVFQQRVLGAELIFEFLKKHGYTQVVLVTGQTSESETKIALDIFAKASHGILVTTTKLDEGIDVPDCNKVVIFNGSKSKLQMIQRVGRGCRARPGKVEEVYELVSTPSAQVIKASGYHARQMNVEGKTLDQVIIEKSFAELKKAPWSREVNIGDAALMTMFQVDDKALAIREALLGERIKSAYRNIDDTINPEAMKTLLSKFKRTEVPVLEHKENWDEVLAKLGAKSRAQRLSRSAEPSKEGIASLTWNYAIKIPKAMITNLPFGYRTKEDKDKVLVEVTADPSIITMSKTTLTKLSAKQRKTMAIGSISWNGEVIVPRTLREVMTIKYKDEVNVKIDGEKVVITRLSPPASRGA
jgi:superfamily II DNA or RNA helicase